MNFKKRVNGSWTDTPHYIHNTSTDTLTTLPADLYADGNNATVGLVGNMLQNGTPTPTTPIQPSECGERTANLFDKDNPRIYNGYYKAATNQLTPYPANAYIYVSVEPNKTYFIYNIKRYDSTSTTRWVTTENTFTDNSNVIRTDVIQPTAAVTTITTGANERFLGLFMCADVDYQGYGSVSAAITANCANLTIDNGYKLTISSANTTTPVYLGEVETTRRVKKLVLTGQENWFYRQGNPPNIFFIDFSGCDVVSNVGLCTHYLNQDSGSFDVLEDKHSIIKLSSIETKWYLGIRDSSYSIMNNFKAYLAAQYANGTPVTVWYVQSTPTTGTVNEPLRKIGNYADTVSAITIPTITGKDTVDVETTLRPSEVELTYTGWHDASVKEAVRTANIYDKYNIIDIPNLGLRYGVECELGTYSIYNNTNNTVYWGANNWASRHVACEPNSTTTITIQGTGVSGFIMPYNEESLGEITIVKGSTVPDHYIPYIDWD